jgi:methylated-DNA-[protein]-cysteine S-methyltransferase
MNLAHTIVDSPLGPLVLSARGGRLTGLHIVADGPPPRLPAEPVPDAAPFDSAREQLERYFDGALTEFDLPLDLAGSRFCLRVWEALREIPYGQTLSYGELALRVGRPGAARAVGIANARNPVAIVVPCHRVIGADGSLTGYGGGKERKRALLELEAGRLALTV